jgi:alanyl-tRNA synthetase
MLKAIDLRAAHLDKVEVDLREWEKRQAKAEAAQLRSRAAIMAKDLEAKHAAGDSLVEKLVDADGNLLEEVADALKGKVRAPIFLASVTNGLVQMVAAVPKHLTAKLEAGKLIQQLAPIVGGKGGGRPENARGAGKDVDKIDTLMAEAKRLLSSLVTLA